MAGVKLEGLCKRYPGGTEVLRGIDLEIADGELLALVGPSGCGKSTLLNLVAGLERASSGTIAIDGRPVDHLDPSERDVAMVFQSYALYPHMDVHRNIAFPLENARLPKPEIARRVRETAARLGIEALLARKPRQLSGGQRQRVALARALVRRPKIFLFDEPLSNLDADLRAQMRGELKKLHESLGATFLYVTHDQMEAMTLATRVALLHAGRLEQCAPPLELYERPASLFVAGFVGSPPINQLAPAPFGRPSGTVVGVRPEDVSIGLGAPPSGARVGTVYVVEPVGPYTWVTLQVGDERIVGRASRDFSVRSGEGAWALVAPERLLTFDGATGRRLD